MFLRIVTMTFLPVSRLLFHGVVAIDNKTQMSQVCQKHWKDNEGLPITGGCHYGYSMYYIEGLYLEFFGFLQCW